MPSLLISFTDRTPVFKISMAVDKSELIDNMLTYWSVCYTATFGMFGKHLARVIGISLLDDRSHMQCVGLMENGTKGVCCW